MASAAPGGWPQEHRGITKAQTYRVRAFVRISEASEHPGGISPTSRRCRHRRDQLPVSFSRRAASASSEASVPSAGEESEVDEEDEPFESEADEPLEE